MIEREKDNEDYDFKCIVTGRYTQLASHTNRLPFYSEKFRNLYNEWVSLVDYSISIDKSLVIPSGAPGFHSLDTPKIHVLKVALFQLLDNNSETTIRTNLDYLLISITETRDLYKKWFFDDTQFNVITNYISELDSNTQIKTTNTVLLQKQKNTMKAIAESRNATRRRYNEWFTHLNTFISYWMKYTIKRNSDLIMDD